MGLKEPEFPMSYQMADFWRVLFNQLVSLSRF